VVYGTTDGGDHWNRQELDPPAGGRGSAVATLESVPQEMGGRSSPSMVVTVLDPGPGQGTFLIGGRYVYTWRSPTWTGPVPVPGGPFAVVDQVDQAHWFATIGTLVLETTDAGKNWREVGQVPDGWLVSRLAMVDRSNGWALVLSPVTRDPAVPPATGLARTVDGGRHWTLVSTPS